ncbi:hypothetical protein KW798_01290 [Candidatus Parcubacteria bacterium]|nr:hypothetical protein [Candidatus Parcubacteria bacterium]
MGVARTSPASFLKHAADVASSYGFRPMREVERLAQGKIDRIRGSHSLETVLQVSAAAMGLHSPEPMLTFYATPSPTFLPQPMRESGEFGLSIMGTSESVGEVVLLKAVAAILNEWGSPIARVRLNALGDKDSRQRFERELSLYMRKHGPHFDDFCREQQASNIFGVYGCQNEQCRTILSEGPRAMNFLSEKSRSHLREVLEHVEKLGLPYSLDDLLTSQVPEPRLVFAFDLAEEDATVVGAVGGRFDDYVRKLTGRKEGYAVTASIYFRKKGAARSHFVYDAKARNPKIYFVQLGLRAKLQGLAVLDVLRQARIPVSQSFDSAHLSPQLLHAKELGVSHLLIMGHREALDGTVIIRSTINSSQEIVAVGQLPRYLKALR